MNWFLFSATAREKNDTHLQVIVEGLCGFLFDSDRRMNSSVIGNRASIQQL